MRLFSSPILCFYSFGAVRGNVDLFNVLAVLPARMIFWVDGISRSVSFTHHPFLSS